MPKDTVPDRGDVIAETPAGPDRLRALIIHNPNAGRRRRRGRLAAVIAELKRLGATVELKTTAGAGDAERYSRAAQASAAAGDGPDVVVSAGGDGTVNEVMSGLVGGTLPLALLPMGTANVLAAEIGLKETTTEIARAILRGPVVPIYLGDANGRRFTLMAGIGLDAEAVATVNPRLKRAIGKFAYVYATFKRWLVSPQHRLQIEIDGAMHTATAVVIANGHYYGGRFVCADAARLTDPHLHVCLFEKPGRWRAAWYMAGLLGGFLHRMKHYQVIAGREILIRENGALPVQGDGDIIARLPVRIRIADKMIPLVMPAVG